MQTKYVKAFTSELKNETTGKRLATLLWGDAVQVLDDTGSNWKVKARGQVGRIGKDQLTDSSLLEIYVIDVGQGDGILLKTPNDRWHLIDGGVSNSEQMTKKGTANFLRWKFQDDLGKAKVSLENMILTHPDADHFGGLIDVMSGKLYDGRTFPIEIQNFYHPGLAPYKGTPALGSSLKGAVGPFPCGQHGVPQKGQFFTELLSEKNSFANPPHELDTLFGKFAGLVAFVPNNVQRLSHRDLYLPGYSPSPNNPSIRVLGPILEELTTGQLGLRSLGKESITRNGHSVVLRVDFGKARILLTGDLNSKSHALLLSYHAPAELAVDVAKACHHGAEDVDVNFIKALQARTTVISSGDNEDYSHPRPLLLGASARYGRECKDPTGDEMPPLLYSTELARSVKLQYAVSARTKTNTQPPGFQDLKVADAQVKPAEGDYRQLDRTPIATDLIYGLVNIRTDGKHILCATMLEKGNDFDTNVFQAGV